MRMHADPIGQRRRSTRGHLTSTFALSVALLAAAMPARADHRPFGVLPEGDIRIDAPAEYDAVVPIAGGRFVVEGRFGRVDGQRVAGPVILDRDGRLVRAIPVRCAGAAISPGQRPCRLSLVALPDGGFAVGGAFDEIDGEAIAGIARFRAEGSLDADFRPIASVVPGQALALAGVALGRLYVRSGTTLRRISLAPPHVIDPTYAVHDVDPVHALAPDGRLFVVGRLAGMYTGISRWNPDGSHAGSISGVPEPNTLWFDPGTDRLFALTRDSNGNAAAFTRIDPANGPELDWRLERVPGARGTVTISPRALAAGRIIGEQAVGPDRWLAVNAATSGSLMAAVPLPVAREAAYFGDGASGWIAAPPRREGTGDSAAPRSANPLIRLNAMLSIDSSLTTDIHAIGAAFASAPATGGGYFIGGEFGAVDGVPRHRLARLDPAWRVDPAWQLADAARPRFPIARLGQTSDGFLVAAEFHRLTPFPGVPSPHLVLAAGSGEPAQRRMFNANPFRGLVVGAHVYGSQLCPWPPEQQQPSPSIWRVPVALLMNLPPQFPWQCEFDFTWQADGNGSLLAVSPDGWLYFHQPGVEGGTIRRIRPISGAIPDPAVVMNLPTPIPPASPGFQVFGLAATAAHVYVSVLTQSSGAGELIRFRTSDGQLDPVWPTVALNDVTGALAADAEWVYYWDRLPEGPPPVRPWGLHRRKASDGALGGPLRALESTLPTDSGHPDPTITAIGDGRAIATWRFVALDGVPRDGFAIVGSVEGMLADGFEAP